MIDFISKRTWGPTPKYPTVLSIKPCKPGKLISIAGPCAIENEKQIKKIASILAKAGCGYIRGGAYRAGTYPPDNFGLDRNLMTMFCNVAKNYGLKSIIEILDIRQLDTILADVLQVGARHMQDYALLTELSKQKKPVILKRNMGATLDEFLGAAEYLVRGGKRNVMLCERGSSTHMNHVRWDLSISLIATIKQMTGLPILVDASHGTGRWDLVAPMTRAGIAAGADGYIAEVHPEPNKSLSDADQAIPLVCYPALHKRIQRIWLNR